MDELSKLQALLGEGQVSMGADEDSSPWTHYAKPKHLYEGTDSEDDEDIMREGRVEQSQSSWKPGAAGTSGKTDLLVVGLPLLMGIRRHIRSPPNYRTHQPSTSIGTVSC